MKKKDQMDYEDFIDYLKSKNVAYQEDEGVCIDKWFTSYVEVTPKHGKMKPRYFDNDGGIQLH